MFKYKYNANREDTCDGVTIHENKREHEIMTAVLQEQQAEELPTQLEVRQSLVKSQRTGRRIADQRPLVKAIWISSSNENIFKKFIRLKHFGNAKVYINLKVMFSLLMICTHPRIGKMKRKLQTTVNILVSHRAASTLLDSMKFCIRKNMVLL